MKGREEKRLPGCRDAGRADFRKASKAFFRDSSGTVLLESILVLPLLLMLITGIFQFARFWQARLLTRYAAYNAARAALVYNPVHYRTGAGQFLADRGVCWLAAMTTLSWMSATTDDNNFWMPGYGDVPHSSGIRSQVRVVPSGCKETDGWVKVTVLFQFPTLFAVFDATTMHPPEGGGGHSGIIDPLSDPVKYPHFTFVESCQLPKPWSTGRYPHIGEAEQRLIASRIGGGR